MINSKRLQDIKCNLLIIRLLLIKSYIYIIISITLFFQYHWHEEEQDLSLRHISSKWQLHKLLLKASTFLQYIFIANMEINMNNVMYWPTSYS